MHLWAKRKSQHFSLATCNFVWGKKWDAKAAKKNVKKNGSREQKKRENKNGKMKPQKKRIVCYNWHELVLTKCNEVGKVEFGLLENT